MNNDNVPPPLPMTPHDTLPGTRGEIKISPSTKVLVASFLAIVIWNVLWYFCMHGILFARFKSSAIPSQGTELMVRNYLFKKDIAFTNEIIQIPRREPTIWRRRVIDYDPTGVLDEAYNHLYYNRDVELTVVVSNETLSIIFKPQGKSRLFHKENTYLIGKDCIRRDDNTFSFRYVSTSGGYGMGLLISEIVSTVSLGSDSLDYDVSRSSCGLTFWIIPWAENEESSHLTIIAM